MGTLAGESFSWGAHCILKVYHHENYDKMAEKSYTETPTVNDWKGINRINGTNR